MHHGCWCVDIREYWAKSTQWWTVGGHWRHSTGRLFHVDKAATGNAQQRHWRQTAACLADDQIHRLMLNLLITEAWTNVSNVCRYKSIEKQSQKILSWIDTFLSPPPGTWSIKSNDPHFECARSRKCSLRFSIYTMSSVTEKVISSKCTSFKVWQYNI